MTENKIIHVIRTKSGEVMATARGVTPEAAATWKASGCEVFAFEVELPAQVGVDFVGQAKGLDVG